MADVSLPEGFIDEAVEVFRRMLKVDLVESPPSGEASRGEDVEISVIVSIAGSCPGRLILSFPEGAACGIVSRMSGQPHTEVDADVMDGLEELTNIVAGNGCRHLEEQGCRHVTISLPHVMIGQRRGTGRSRDLPGAVTRCFESELGAVRVEVELNAPCGA